MALTQHRSTRKALYPSHQSSGLEAFTIVGDYVPTDPVLFSGVVTEGTNPNLPNESILADHWLNINRWNIQFSLTLPSVFTSAGRTTSASFIVATGATAGVDDGTGMGDPVTFDTTTPADRADLYKGGVITTIQWASNADEPGDLGLGETDFYTASLTIKIKHGLWAFHNEQAKWMIHLSVDASVHYENDALPAGPDYDETGPPQSYTSCAAGWTWDGIDPVEDPPGTFTWRCVADGPQDGDIALEIDPDGTATEGSGTMLTHAIAFRKTEGETEHTPTLELSLTITKESKYEDWF